MHTAKMLTGLAYRTAQMSWHPNIFSTDFVAAVYFMTFALWNQYNSYFQIFLIQQNNYMLEKQIICQQRAVTH